MRFAASQRDRSLVHPALPQPPSTNQNDGENGLFNYTNTHRSGQEQQQPQQDQHTFVICADTQFGLTSMNREWKTEIEYSRRVIMAINALEPRPLYCCICGDLGDMVPSIYEGSPKDPMKQNNGEEIVEERWTAQECEAIQESQYQDFQSTWSELHPDIALVCLCGNHDVGNRPNAATIQRFKSFFGDDYLAFWANGSYNIVLNTNLFSNPTGAMDLYEQQLTWLRERLEYARHEKNASHIFLYSHHPWFLHHENEDESTDLLGSSPAPEEWVTVSTGDEGVPGFPIADSYFIIPKRYRTQVMEWCSEYNVTAAFAGHFHQNHVATTSFGMPMIVTSSLSVVIRSNSIPSVEPNTRGYRVVTVNHSPDGMEENSLEEKKSEDFGAAAKFSHKFFSLEKLSKC